MAFGFTLVATRALPVAEVGVLFEAIAVFSVVIVVSQLGAASTIVKVIATYLATGRAADVPRGIAVALAPAALLSVVAAVSLFAAAPSASSLLIRHGSHSDAVAYFRTLAVFIPFGCVLAVLLAATRGFGSMSPTVVLDNIAKPGFRLVAIAMVPAIGLSPIAIGALWCAPLVICVAIVVPILRRTIRDRSAGQRVETTVSGSPRAEFAGDYWSFTLPQWLADLFQLSVLWIDVVLLGALSSAREAGIYGAASRLVSVGLLGLAALVLVLGPEMSALLARGDHERVRTLYRNATLGLTVISLPVFLLIAVFSPLLVRMFGAGFAAGGTALTILALAMLVDAAAGPALLTLLMGGHSRLILGDTAVAFAVNIGFNVGLIPVYGMTGAAIAWSASIVLINALAVTQIHRLWRIRAFDAAFFRVVLAAGAVYGFGGIAAKSVFGEHAVTLIGFALIATLAYGGMLWSRRAYLGLIPLIGMLRGKAL